MFIARAQDQGWMQNGLSLLKSSLLHAELFQDVAILVRRLRAILCGGGC